MRVCVIKNGKLREHFAYFHYYEWKRFKEYTIADEDWHFFSFVPILMVVLVENDGIDFFVITTTTSFIDLILYAKRWKNVEYLCEQLELNVSVLVFIKYDTGLIETAKGTRRVATREHAKGTCTIRTIYNREQASKQEKNHAAKMKYVTETKGTPHNKSLLRFQWKCAAWHFSSTIYRVPCTCVCYAYICFWYCK